MNRREALRAVSTAGAVALAGCLAEDVVSGGDGDGNPDPVTDDGTPTPTAPDDGTRTPAPTDESAPTDTPTDVHTAATDWSDDTRSPTGTADGSHVDTVSGTPPGDGDPSATPSPSPTPGTDEPTRTPGPVEDHSFSVTGSGCGSQTEGASVAFDDGVTVTGTIWGNDGCYTARLVEADVSGDELTVVVAAERDADPTTACVMCITMIDYEASFAFVGGTPSTVTVVHVHGDERTKVTTARRG